MAYGDAAGGAFSGVGDLQKAESVCSNLGNVDNSETVWPYLRIALGALAVALMVYPRQRPWFSRRR